MVKLSLIGIKYSLCSSFRERPQVVSSETHSSSAPHLPHFRPLSNCPDAFPHISIAPNCILNSTCYISPKGCCISLRDECFYFIKDQIVHLDLVFIALISHCCSFTR
jgi:hypothetical protein